MKRLLTVAAIVAASLVGCAPAYSSDIDPTERPLEVLARTTVTDCAQAGYIQATDETGQWTLRYYMAELNRQDMTAEFTPEEVIEFDRMREIYDTMKDAFQPEICKSVVDNANKMDAKEAKHWKFVAKP